MIQKIYLWACRRLYGELAWAYDIVSWVVSAGQWTAWRRLALAHLPPSGRVLEIGFGTGELLLDLAAGDREVYGVEPSRAMQQIAGRKLRNSGRQLRNGQTATDARSPVPTSRAPRRVRALAQALPFPDGYFEAAVATFPAEYVFEPRTASEIARVLLSGSERNSHAAGRLVIGPFAVSLNDPGPARLFPIFYGAPPQAFLDRWLASLEAAGLQPRVLQERSGRATAWLVLAERKTA